MSNKATETLVVEFLALRMRDSLVVRGNPYDGLLLLTSAGTKQENVAALGA